MPLVAKDVRTGQRIDITLIDDPRAQLDPEQLMCQVCEQPLIIRGGALVRPHFAHKRSCPMGHMSHPESPEHLAGKYLVAEKVREEWSEYSAAQVEFEFYVPEVQRIIDVAMLFPNGWIVAHEIQLASISPETLEQRTEDYRYAGIDVVWWFGNRANTERNVVWALERFGYVLSLNLNLLRSTR